MDDQSVPLDAEALLGELSWLRRLARQLVGADGVDEDLVQETWLAATRVEGGVSRPWLVGTLRNLAARWHRGESRLRRREALVARPEAVDSASLVERNELFGLVLDQLRSLDEPFRTALLLLYQEGLSIGDAAARLALPVDTLRWQRREGLVRLRRRVDRATRPGLDWRAALLPMTGLPSMTRAGGALASAGAASSLTHVGGLWMTWKLTSAAVLAGLALVLVFTRAGQGAGVQRSSGETAVAVATAVDDVAEHPVGSLESAPPKARVPVVRQGLAALPVDVQPPIGEMVNVHVIDPSNAPVGGARVWIGESADPVGASWVTDDSGMVSMPLPEELVLVSGSTESPDGSLDGALYGKAHLIPSLAGGELLLRLSVDGDVTVVIVDQAGEPIAGVPVAVITRHLKRGALGFHGVTPTDAEGVAVLRHARDRFVLAGNSFEISVGPAVLLRDRPDVPLTEAALPVDPVRITLPETGSLRAVVLNAAGERNLTAGGLNLSVDPNPGSERETKQLARLVGTSPHGVLSVELVDGEASIPFVGLGLALVAHSRRADATDTTFGLAAGPGAAGERGEITLQPLEVAQVISGEARAAEGALLVETALLGTVLLTGDHGESYFPVAVESDGRGRFQIPVGEEMLRAWGPASQRSLRLYAQDASPFDVLATSAGLPDRLQAGRNELGALRFSSAPALVTGRAVDGMGDAVMLTGISVGFGGTPVPGRVRALADARAFTDGSEFAIHGSPLAPGEEVVFWADAEGRPQLRTTSPPGTANVVLVFGDGASLAGKLLTDAGVSPSDFNVRFFVTDGSGARRMQGVERVALNGRFRLAGLSQQIGELEVHEPSTGAVVATVAGVLPVVAHGGQDTRLDPIDLRFALSEFRLSVLDETGEGIAGVTLEAASLPAPVTAFGAGSIRFRAGDASIAAQVRAPGFRPARVVLLPGDQSVTLRAGPVVIVRPGPLADVARGARVVAVLVAVDHSEEVVLERREDGSHVGSVSRAGEYELLGRLERHGVLLAELPFSREGAGSLHVTDQGSPQTFDVSFDRAAFDARVPPE